MAKIILFDSTKINGRAQILFTLTGGAAATVLGAKADLIDEDTTVLQQLQIERIRWNSVSTVTGIELSFAGSTAFSIMELVGSGHWYHDLAITPEKIKEADVALNGYDYGYKAGGGGTVANPDEDGDIIVEAKGSGNATVILDIRKIKGYASRSDYANVAT